MIYTVKRIDEDLDFGCEERAKDAPVNGSGYTCRFIRRRIEGESRGCPAL